MARLSALDASFLRAESPTAHMHVGWLASIELPPGARRLDTRLLSDRVAARLHLAPRFRQRVVKMPLSVAEPVWQDDTEFDIRRHIREATGLGEVTSQDLRPLIDEFLSRPLSRERPLWEILLVPRMRGGRAAVLGKIHHAMVDGIAAVELGMLLFDLGPEPDRPSPVDWSPQAPDGPLRLAVDSVTDRAVDQFRAARRLVTAGRSPGQTIRVADTMRRAAFSLAEDALSPAPDSYLNPPIGARRTLVAHSVRLARLLALKERHQATLNDVTLAVCTGALRQFALKSGHEPHDLRVMVPVNVRDEGDPEAGNRITFVFVDLPVSRPRASERLAAVAARMAEIKSSGSIDGSARLLRGLGVLPEPLKERAARLAMSPRLHNLTISSVPGPRAPLYVAGGRVRTIHPVIPIPDLHALAVGVLTYEEHAHFGIHAEPRALPRVGRLPVMLDDALVELEVASERATSTRSARRARRRGPTRRRAGARGLD